MLKWAAKTGRIDGAEKPNAVLVQSGFPFFTELIPIFCTGSEASDCQVVRSVVTTSIECKRQHGKNRFLAVQPWRPKNCRQMPNRTVFPNTYVRHIFPLSSPTCLEGIIAKRKRISAELTKTRRPYRRKATGRGRAWSVGWKVSGAGHRRFYREWQGRAHQWPTEDSQGADGMFRKQAGQKQRLPWRLRQCRIAKRAEPRCREGQPKAA